MANTDKVTCLGCRALNMKAIRLQAKTKRGKELVAMNIQCNLGYKIILDYKYPNSLPIPVPANKHCPKPRTYKALGRLLDEKTGQSRTKA